ncbi:hypothetical protein ACS0TY_036811 [Phlomoides rotata]
MVEGSEARRPGSKTALSFESMGGRLRFTVELRPGETKIVSWKKLIREAKLSNSHRPESSSGTSSEARRSFVSEPPPPPSVVPSSTMQKTEDEYNDSQAQAGSNRLSNVIEKIERMYAGNNGSSDEEDLVLDNVPDDDDFTSVQDDYFQVDNSAIKHDGFFVNRGKLERREPIVSKDQQPKKRRRKDLIIGSGSDDGHNPHKIMKMGNKGKKASSSIQISSTSQSHKEATSNIHKREDLQANAADISLRKKADIHVKVDSSGLRNGDAIKHDVDTNQQRPGVFPSNNTKESEIQDTSAQRSIDKKSHKAALIQRKEGPSVRPKSLMLEKAIRDLEKMVAQFRPPTTEAQDPDIASQAVKRRLPPEIKQKLAKVARIAQAGYGKVPKDVINHLMSIVGHLMHITTLKRNLKAMVNMELSVKQEKDDQIQKIKQEVSEMVKLRISHTKPKLEQHDANSDNFQEAGLEEREVLKHKYSIDDILENKICDLYDLYVERLEEDSGPPVRRLYEELALMWPSGVMHVDGIKRAIYRSKDRKGLCSHTKNREKIKKKKVLPPKAENATNVTQASHVHEKSMSNSCAQRSTLPSNSPIAIANRQEKLKQGKMSKCGSSSNPTATMPSNVFSQKKVKQKPKPEVAEAQLHLEKLAVSLVEKQPKQNKHSATPLSKSNLQPPAPSGPST